MRVGALCLLLASLDAEAVAQTLSQSERAVINFGFATQLGSGIYTMSGRTLQVYRIPFAWDLPAEPQARFKLRLTLPLTIGFVDFKPLDVVDNGLPHRLDSLSLVPGLEADVRLRDSWMVQPFVEAGIARDRTNEADQRVFAIGLRSYYDFRRGATDWTQYDELVHVVVEQQSPHSTDDFTRLRVGMSARRPFDAEGSGRRADVLGYGFVEVFTDAPAGPASDKRNGGAPAQFEFGFTFGATERWQVWRIPLPRLGFGYRFGDGLSVYRFVIGSPY
jgi:hypothetical protein